MKVEIQENSLYAPIRYEATRRYARTLGRLYVAHSNQGKTTRIQFLQNDLLTRLREEVAD